MDKSFQFKDERNDSGEFIRQEDAFSNFITNDKNAKFLAEKNRYHLYASYACPWAHRIILIRVLKNLEDIIGLTIVNPIRNENDGWEFFNTSSDLDGFREHGADDINNFLYLKEAYLKTDPNYTGRVTVPVLWDKKKSIIVSNSDDDLLRMLNSCFNDFLSDEFKEIDFYPDKLRFKIDRLNIIIYNKVNDGVYKAGFATKQKVYEKCVYELFDTLDMLESKLARNKDEYLFGKKLTETDLRLFVTLIRFDAVYHGHFKCNLRRLIDYPNLYNYMIKIYNLPKVSETVNFDHIKRHYYYTHDDINPTRVVPAGPSSFLYS